MITDYTSFEEHKVEEAVRESVNSMVAPTIEDAVEFAKIESERVK